MAKKQIIVEQYLSVVLRKPMLENFASSLKTAVLDLFSLQPRKEYGLLDTSAQPAPGHQVLHPLLMLHLLGAVEADDDKLGVIADRIPRV